MVFREISVLWPVASFMGNIVVSVGSQMFSTGCATSNKNCIVGHPVQNANNSHDQWLWRKKELVFVQNLFHRATCLSSGS